MGEEVQHTTYDSFTKNTRGVEILDPMTTNALLLKNNLDANSIKTMLPQEVAKAIGVEFVFTVRRTSTMRVHNPLGVPVPDIRIKKKGTREIKKALEKNTVVQVLQPLKNTIQPLK